MIQGQRVGFTDRSAGDPSFSTPDDTAVTAVHVPLSRFQFCIKPDRESPGSWGGFDGHGVDREPSSPKLEGACYPAADASGRLL